MLDEVQARFLAPLTVPEQEAALGLMARLAGEDPSE